MKRMPIPASRAASAKLVSAARVFIGETKAKRIGQLSGNGQSLRKLVEVGRLSTRTVFTGPEAATEYLFRYRNLLLGLSNRGIVHDAYVYWVMALKAVLSGPPAAAEGAFDALQTLEPELRKRQAAREESRQLARERHHDLTREMERAKAISAVKARLTRDKYCTWTNACNEVGREMDPPRAGRTVRNWTHSLKPTNKKKTGK
jgi:hypothetical protein